jgi:hypothetical protein
MSIWARLAGLNKVRWYNARLCVCMCAMFCPVREICMLEAFSGLASMSVIIM